MKVKIYNQSQNPLPKYQTDGAAGFDLCSNEELILMPGERQLVGTGLFFELPKGTEMQIRPRSGLAYSFGITVLNSPGTIDSDYRGEIKVLLINHGSASVEIKVGERIAQAVIAKYKTAKFFEVSSKEEFTSSNRGEKGFGSTGSK